METLKKCWFRTSFIYQIPAVAQEGQVRGPREEVVLAREGKWVCRRMASLILFSSRWFQFQAHPTHLLRLEAPSRGHLTCFPTFRDKTSSCVCNYQGFTAVAALHSLRQALLPPRPPPITALCCWPGNKPRQSSPVLFSTLAFWMLTVSSHLSIKQRMRP